MRVQVLIIGGGVAGLGIAWDLTLRSIECVVVERDDLCADTTGRCHGLLHGGGRYAVSDPITARACAEENRIIRKIAGPLVEDGPGLFFRNDYVP
jgi:glycerol-3-phosphate dehydrogenase|tara:strand:- start:445 stop:729 length:285 start_codon:yes stop_codon:yes gene_type:complete